MDSFKRFAGETDGVMAALAAILVPILIGIGAFAYDASRAWSLQSELQSAADAAALAGASQLDREAGAITRAVQAASARIQNQQTFATDGQGADVAFDTSQVAVWDYTDVKFYQDRAKTIPATGDGDADYIEVSVQPRAVAGVFAAVAGVVGDLRPRATATAHMGSAVCQVPPLFFCVPSGGLTAGQGMWLKGKPNGGSGSWFPGNFGILALNNPDGSTSLSASLIRDAMGREPPRAECYGRDGEVQTKPGETTTIRDGLNVRFNIYQGSSKDLVNDGNYLPAPNTLAGLMAPGGSKCSFNANNSQGWHKPAAPYDGDATTADGDPTWVEETTVAGTPSSPMGLPRDTCVYDGSCVPGTNSGAAGRFGPGDWDVDSYRQVNHPAMSASAFEIAVCGSLGCAPTRYEVYLWELADPANEPTGPEDMFHGGQCSTTPSSSGQRRRVITMVGLDCSGLSGTATTTAQSFHEVFLTEPMGVFDGNNDLYGEYIGETTPGNNPAARWVLELVE